MTPTDFRAWHEAMGYTYDTGAAAYDKKRKATSLKAALNSHRDALVSMAYRQLCSPDALRSYRSSPA